MSDEDPLEHADVGERKHVRKDEVVDMYLPDVCHGTDRDASDVELIEAKVVETEYGPKIHAIWDGEVMKTLPPSWDTHNEPVTEQERKQHRQKKWFGRIAAAVAAVVSVGGAMVLTWPMMSTLSDLTINGEPVGPVTPLDFVPVVMIFLLIAIVVFGSSYILPGMRERRAGR